MSAWRQDKLVDWPSDLTLTLTLVTDRPDLSSEGGSQREDSNRQAVININSSREPDRAQWINYWTELQRLIIVQSYGGVKGAKWRQRNEVSDNTVSL
jgi:hypothetical protein